MHYTFIEPGFVNASYCYLINGSGLFELLIQRSASDIIAGWSSTIRWNRSGMRKQGWHSDNLLQRNTVVNLWRCLSKNKWLTEKNKERY